MAIVKVVCTRLAEDDNVQLTYGVGRAGGVTLTGEIYDAEEYESLVEDDFGILRKIDSSDLLRKCTASITFAGNGKRLQEAVADYFTKAKEDGVFQIKIGIVIEVDEIPKPKDGVHPTKGHKTKTVLLNNAFFNKVERPKVLEEMTELIDEFKTAREVTKENNKAGLAALLGKKVNDANSMITNALKKKVVS